MAFTHRIMQASDEAAYDEWVKGHPEGSLWQSLEWKVYQESIGREVRIFLSQEEGGIKASALIVIDKGSWNLSTWDCPRGPIGEDAALSGLSAHVEAEARKAVAMSLYVSPAHERADFASYALSKRSEQPKATIMLDLTLSEEELLKQMHQKGRYNIRLAEKRGVRVEQSNDIGAFHALLRKTGKRDGFTIKSLRHYEAFVHDLPGAFLLLARHPETDDVIGGLLGVVWGKTGIYYYGASDHDARDVMAPYLLQWHAMRLCKAKGCTSYDLLGISPPGIHDSWAGITDFKRKFGGETVLYAPERTKTIKPLSKTLLTLKRNLLG